MSTRTDDDFALQAFFDELDREFRGVSERDTVLLCTSALDEALLRLIRAFLVEGKDSRRLLKSERAPLMTLASRTSMAFALGLLTANEKMILDDLRSIRNDAVRQLEVPLSSISTIRRLMPEELKPESLRPRDIILATAVWLVGVLSVRIGLTARVRSQELPSAGHFVVVGHNGARYLGTHLPDPPHGGEGSLGWDSTEGVDS